MKSQSDEIRLQRVKIVILSLGEESSKIQFRLDFCFVQILRFARG